MYTPKKNFKTGEVKTDKTERRDTQSTISVGIPMILFQ